MTKEQEAALARMPTSTVRAVTESHDGLVVYLENGRRFYEAGGWYEMAPVPGTMAAMVAERAGINETALDGALEPAPF